MRRPYITLKFAQTVDGRIAAKDGSSKWISSPQSLKYAHTLRAGNDAILVGIGTILKDNPSLTARRVKGKNPTRVIIDSKLRISPNARVIKNIKTADTVIITTSKASKAKMNRLKERGVEFIIAPLEKTRNVDLYRIIRILDKKGMRKILVEGGSRIITSFLKKRLANKIIAIISPKILGKGIDAVGDLNISNIKGILNLHLKSVKKLGKDIVYIAHT